MKYLLNIDNKHFDIELSEGETKLLEFELGRFAKVTALAVIESPTLSRTGSGFLRVEFDNGNVWDSKIATIAKVANYDGVDYNVYLCSPVENTRVASFALKTEALWYVKEMTKGCEQLNPADTDNGNNHHWYEIYHGEPVSEDGMELREPVYTSPAYYND